jgi:heme-degrading monooxygenase HmoA
MNAPSPTSSGSEPPALIARVWHGVTPKAKSAAYTAYLGRTGVRDCRATPGNRGGYVLRRTQGNETEFTFISLWESLDAIRRFAGDDHEKARYYPEDAQYLLDLEPFVLHYEVVTAP